MDDSYWSNTPATDGDRSKNKPKPLRTTELPSDRSSQAAARVEASLRTQLGQLGADWGAALYLRIFKASDELEVWVDTGVRHRPPGWMRSCA